jgi:hypothetical protein
MSTRATYLFKGNDFRPDVCLYIHHDGYEEGAASYLYAAFRVSGSLSAEDMIRGNDKAEFTESHDAHGDTEYRYMVDKNQLTVSAGYGDTWRTVFSGDWVDFINKYLNPAWIDHDFQPIKRVKVDTYGQIQAHTPQSLKELELDELRLLGIWSINGHTEGANYKNLVERIKLIQSHLQAYGAPTWKEAA